MRLFPSFAKARIIGALALCILLLAGCSVLRITYPQVPALAYWMIDNYVDFTSAQATRVREQIGQVYAWHRTTQLPVYAALLQRARTEVVTDVTPAQVCRWVDEVQAQANAAFDYALPAVAETALTLNADQLAHMQGRFDKTNADFRDDYMQPDRKERLKESVKRTVDRFETLYDSIDDRQRAQIAREVAASPFDAELWFADRVSRQQVVLQTLRRLQRERASPAQAQTALRMLADQLQNSRNPTMHDAQERLKRYGCEFAARFHNGTTTKQRQAAAERLKGWEEDVRALAADPKGPSGGRRRRDSPGRGAFHFITGGAFNAPPLNPAAATSRVRDPTARRPGRRLRPRHRRTPCRRSGPARPSS